MKMNDKGKSQRKKRNGKENERIEGKGKKGKGKSTKNVIKKLEGK